MEPSLVHGIEGKTTTLGESDHLAVATAKRVAILLNYEPDCEFSSLLTGHDITVVTYVGFGAADTSTAALSAVKRS